MPKKKCSHKKICGYSFPIKRNSLNGVVEQSNYIAVEDQYENIRKVISE